MKAYPPSRDNNSTPSTPRRAAPRLDQIRHRLLAACYGTTARVLFSRLDKSHDGTLDTATFRHAMRHQLHVTPSEVTDAEINKLLGALDDDGTGTINLDEVPWHNERWRCASGCARRGMKRIRSLDRGEQPPSTAMR